MVYINNKYKWKQNSNFYEINFHCITSFRLPDAVDFTISPMQGSEYNMIITTLPAKQPITVKSCEGKNFNYIKEINSNNKHD